MYIVELLSSVAKDVRSLPKKTQVRIIGTLEALQKEPRPPGARQLRVASPPRYRIRVGDYRVIYQIKDTRLLVLVVKVGHRRGIYR